MPRVVSCDGTARRWISVGVLSELTNPARDGELGEHADTNNRRNRHKRLLRD